jgi:hypothetical protein
MIFIDVMGGAGNQLFQFSRLFSISLLKGEEFNSYAFFINKRLRKKSSNTRRDYNLELILDRDQTVKRSFSLFIVQTVIKLSKGAKKLSGRFEHNDGVYTLGLAGFFRRIDLASTQALEKSKNIYLDGYFQNSKFLFPIQDEIRSYILKRLEHELRRFKVYEQFSTVDTAVIHIRRGDYLGLGKALDGEYFLCAMEHFRKNCGVRRFLAFSDDEAWCNGFLNGIQDVQLVETRNLHPIVIIAFMSKFPNKILSNSTFSWWSHFLGGKDQILVVPRSWSNDFPELEFNAIKIISI